MDEDRSLVTVYTNEDEFRQYQKNMPFFVRLDKCAGLIELRIPKDWIGRKESAHVYQAYCKFPEFGKQEE